MDSNPDTKPKKKYVKKEYKQKIENDKKQDIISEKDKQKTKYVPKPKFYAAKDQQQQQNKDSSLLSIASEASKIPNAPKFPNITLAQSMFKMQQSDSDNYLMPVKDLVSYADNKKLKKYFFEVHEQADRVVLMYYSTKPAIIFQYQIKEFKQTRPLRDLLRANENLKKNRELILRIYDALYRRLQQKYYEIGHFGVEVAKQRRLNFRDRNFLNRRKVDIVQQYPIYYAIKGEKINFLMFDSNANSVQFNTDNILGFQKKNQDYFDKFKQFERAQFKQIKAEEMMVENFGQEEVDSDQQSRAEKISKQKQVTLGELRVKINRILEKDIEDFQTNIDNKDERVRNLMKNNTNGKQVQLVEKLADEVMEQQATLDNFTDIKEDVEKKINGMFTDTQHQLKVLKSSLKRLILAEKQLVSKLPIISRKRQIFQKLNKNNLLILEGETGSGKSTQLPQLLCEYYKVFQNQSSLPVLITQPRKLATRTLAERVASEMEERVHGFVDYQTTLTTKVNEKAKIIFKMDRLVLDQLKIDPKLSKYCCLVIDEAHERTISIDVILGLIKNLLTLRNDFKIIVTSASMDIDLFRKYYKTDVLKVSGRMFPVEQIFEPYDHQKDKTRKIMKVIDERLLDDQGRNLRQQYRGHVLVFCSGIDQISQLVTHFSNKLNPRIFKVHALHGKLTPDEQREVFADTQEYKIIFSTRIAETSITIDKVRVVIDPGEDRQLVYDQKNKVTTLKLKQISQSSAKQRAGRAGRTNEGYCFRLYSKKAKGELKANKTPQIQNMALDTVVLRLKSLQIKDIISFPYLSPPSKQGLLNSIEIMKMLKCLDDKTEEITIIGELLVKIPIEPFLARAIVEAMLLQKVIKSKKDILNLLKMSDRQIDKLVQINLIEEVIKILCSVISSTNLFYIRPEDRERAQKMKFEKLSDQDGDFFFLQNIYNDYIYYYNKRQPNQMKKWAYDHFLSLKTLNQIRQLEREITQIIKQYSIGNQSLGNELLIAQAKLLQVKTVREAILSCLVSSFATNLALYSNNEQIGYTVISLETSMQIYGTSILSLQGISPKWILYYDLYENEKGQIYCKVANSIDHSFLVKNSNPYVVKKFKIVEAQKLNPFYEKMTHKLPSLLYLHILNDYQRRYFEESTHLQFLRKFSINFYQDLNMVEIFYRKGKKNEQVIENYWSSKLKYTMNKFLNLSKYKQSQDHEEIIAGYLKQLYQKHYMPLRYNYVGPINICLDKGLQLLKIDFKVIEHQYRVNATGDFSHYIHLYCHQFGTCDVYQDCLIFRIIEEEDRVQFEKTLNQLIENFKLGNGVQIKYTHDLEDRRKKIPQAKLFIHFWAGESKKQNIYLNYSGNQDLQSSLYKEKWMQDIIDCFHSQKLSVLGKNNKLLGFRFQLAKNKRGINCFSRFNEQIDEIQFTQILKDYDKRKLLELKFQMPSTIQKFRDPDITLASRSQKEWQNDIKKLLVKQGIPEEKVAVRAWGRDLHNKNQKGISVFEKNFKVEWHAQVKTFDLKQLLKFKERNNKKTGILGNQKAHFMFQFQHVAVVTTLNCFEALQDEYQDKVDYTRAENPSITIEHYSRSFKKLTKVFIKVRGQNRDELIAPSLRLIQLFSPKIIPLVQSKFRFLDRMDEGNKILEDIENEYKLQIYFAFERKTYSLKVYCNTMDLNNIIKKLNHKLEQFKFFEDDISYRGKNLNKVKEIIEQKIDQIRRSNDKKKFLNYQIQFKFRKVRIIGDLVSCDEVKNQIMKIVEKDKSQCDICCDLLQKPYKLFICKHQFCMLCLISYIRQSSSNASGDLLKCPGCPELISVYDVQKIMSEEEFNKLCDIQISRYIQKQPKYHGCNSPNCENIFLSDESKKDGYFECELCGKWFCFKCNQSHKGFTCEEWRFKLDDSSLKSLGIKKCPKCGEGIQKNAGCQHMTCAKCNSHICWNCLKLFATAKQCYDHLAKQCGGIFSGRP